MSAHRLLIALVATPLLAGATCQRKPDFVPPPDAGKPVHTVTSEVRYVPVGAALTRRCPVEPAGALSDAPLVAAKRKAALETCNAQLEAIEKIQGTKVEE